MARSPKTTEPSRRWSVGTQHASPEKLNCSEVKCEGFQVFQTMARVSRGVWNLTFSHFRVDIAWNKDIYSDTKSAELTGQASC